MPERRPPNDNQHNTNLHYRRYLHRACMRHGGEGGEVQICQQYQAVGGTGGQEMSAIKRIWKWLSLKCPDCGGVMENDDCHITRFGTQINVYTCQECKRQWI